MIVSYWSQLDACWTPPLRHHHPPFCPVPSRSVVATDLSLFGIYISHSFNKCSQCFISINYIKCKVYLPSHAKSTNSQVFVWMHYWELLYWTGTCICIGAGKTSLHTFAGASVWDGLSHVSVVALFTVVTVASGRVVSTVEANSSAPASWQLIQLHVEPTAACVQVTVTS